MIYPKGHWARNRAENIVDSCYLVSVKGESSFFKRSLITRITKVLIETRREGEDEALNRAIQVALATCSICNDAQDDMGNKAAHVIANDLRNLLSLKKPEI